MSSSDRASLAHQVPPAVVIGVDSITGLQTARILAARSVPVYAVAADRRHWGARTNACVEVVEAALSGRDLVESLVALGRRLDQRAVLVPCTDAAVDTVSRYREELAPGFVLGLAEHPVVELLMDKVRFARHALDNGLPVPRTEVLTDRTQATSVAASI